jgi:hypothetical protein
MIETLNKKKVIERSNKNIETITIETQKKRVVQTRR